MLASILQSLMPKAVGKSGLNPTRCKEFTVTSSNDRILPCRGRWCEFEPRRDRHKFMGGAQGLIPRRES